MSLNKKIQELSGVLFNNDATLAIVPVFFLPLLLPLLMNNGNKMKHVGKSKFSKGLSKKLAQQALAWKQAYNFSV